MCVLVSGVCAYECVVLYACVCMLCACVCMLCAHARVRVCVCTCVHVCVHAHGRPGVGCVCVWLHVCLCPSVCVCVCVCVCSLVYSDNTGRWMRDVVSSTCTKHCTISSPVTTSSRRARFPKTTKHTHRVVYPTSLANKNVHTYMQ